MIGHESALHSLCLRLHLYEFAVRHCFLSRLLSHLQRRTQILRKLDERAWRLLQEVRIIHENLLQEELWKVLIDTNFIPISHSRSMIKIND